MKRKALLNRETAETKITGKLDIDGTGEATIKTGIGILDHMLQLFAFHGLFDLSIAAKGDLEVDIHHTNEDIGIALGKAFKDAMKEKKGIRRFGFALVPMEDVLATVAVDISGRGFFGGVVHETSAYPECIADETGYSFTYVEHFFESFAKNLGINLIIKIRSTNPDLHTNLEPIFKALGLALDQATQIDPRRKKVPSTKGIID